MSVQVGAKYLEKMNGGKGILLGGVPGVPAANVVIIGGGVVGTNAAKMAVGLGADVTILDRDLDRLRQLDEIFLSKVRRWPRSRYAIEEAIAHADLVIGAVLVVGAAAPKLVTRDMLKLVPQGAVIVDVAVDQGGCFETTHATTHSNPTYYEEGVVALLRRQHAGCGAANINLRADECDSAVRSSWRARALSGPSPKTRALRRALTHTLANVRTRQSQRHRISSTPRSTVCSTAADLLRHSCPCFLPAKGREKARKKSMLSFFRDV